MQWHEVARFVEFVNGVHLMICRFAVLDNVQPDDFIVVVNSKTKSSGPHKHSLERPHQPHGKSDGVDDHSDNGHQLDTNEFSTAIVEQAFADEPRMRLFRREKSDGKRPNQSRQTVNDRNIKCVVNMKPTVK